MNLSEEKKIMLKAAKQAGKILMKNYGRVKFIKVKDKNSYVTNADLESEKYIVAIIRKNFPHHNIVSEESKYPRKKSDFTWYIDPLDGTHNYINKIPIFGVSIALGHKEKIVIGVISLPYINEVYFAEKGKGAFLNGKSIKVSKKQKLSKAFVLTDIIIRRTAIKNLEIIKKLNNVVYDVRFFGSAVFCQAYLARGSADIYFTNKTNSWDIAAGLLIAEEAGAIATDFNGHKWAPKEGAFVAANKQLHNKILKILNK